MCILTVYRRLQQPMARFLSLMDELISNLTQVVPTIILGDFNDDLSISSSSRLLQFMSTKGFSQLAQVPTTDSGSLLDYIYCNGKDRIVTLPDNQQMHSPRLILSFTYYFIFQVPLWWRSNRLMTTSMRMHTSCMPWSKHNCTLIVLQSTVKFERVIFILNKNCFHWCDYCYKSSQNYSYLKKFIPSEILYGKLYIIIESLLAKIFVMHIIADLGEIFVSESFWL